MIESCYWKEELARIAGTVSRVKKPRRWSERAHCVVERDLMIGFFILRRMIELKKVSSAIADAQVQVFSYTSRGKPVNKLNHADLSAMYDMTNEVVEYKKPMYLSNQFIHAYTSFVDRDDSRNWSDVLIVSDYDRNDCIWRVPVEAIRSLFLAASQDYPATVCFIFNPKTNDYDVSPS